MRINPSRNAYLDTRLSIFQSRLKDIEWFDRQVEVPKIASEELLEELHICMDDGIDDRRILDGSLFLECLLKEYQVILRPTTGTSRKLLKNWIKHLELRNLKTILRGVLKKTPVEHIRNDLIELGQMATLPFEKLLRSDDIMEFLRVMDKTSYSAMSRQARQLFEKHNDPFFVDASIDQRYFADIANSIALLENPSKKFLHDLFGSIIDQHNLLWLLRYRFTYALNPAETWYLLVSGGSQLTTSNLLKLVELNSVDEVIDQLPERLSSYLQKSNGIFDIDQRMEKSVEDIAWRMTKFNAPVLARALAWLILREKQLVRTGALLKGRKLSLEPQLIRIGMGLRSQ